LTTNNNEEKGRRKEKPGGRTRSSFSLSCSLDSWTDPFHVNSRGIIKKEGSMEQFRLINLKTIEK